MIELEEIYMLEIRLFVLCKSVSHLCKEKVQALVIFYSSLLQHPEICSWEMARNMMYRGLEKEGGFLKKFLCYLAFFFRSHENYALEKSTRCAGI